MNDLLIEQPYQCPYCGEQIHTFVDASQSNQQIIEDCSVCCRPIELTIVVDENNQQINLTVRTESE